MDFIHEEIKTISLSLPHSFGTVNCYLINTAAGFILVDTGYPKMRTNIEKELEDAGYRHGNLLLIVITHGDGDHAGNAAYLREKFGGKIAVHPLELAAVECGDGTLSLTRTRFQRVLDRIVLVLASLFINLGKSDEFKPDLLVDDGFDLAPFGWAAKLIHIPGHPHCQG
jgi:glyoxylase-like metal-dependent hydrolase (beta-lactamase superfamily II)